MLHYMYNLTKISLSLVGRVGARIKILGLRIGIFTLAQWLYFGMFDIANMILERLAWCAFVGVAVLATMDGT